MIHLTKLHKYRRFLQIPAILGFFAFFPSPLLSETQVIYTPMIEAYASGQQGSARELAAQYIDGFLAELSPLPLDGASGGSSLSGVDRAGSLIRLLGVLRFMLQEEIKIDPAFAVKESKLLRRKALKALAAAKDGVLVLADKPENQRAFLEREIEVIEKLLNPDFEQHQEKP